MCIRLKCLQGSYRYLTNWHQATKLHYIPKSFKDIGFGNFFHLQLLTFYHNTIDFLHVMTRSIFIPNCTYPCSLNKTSATWLQAEPSLIIKLAKYIHKYKNTRYCISDKEMIHALLLLLLLLLFLPDKKEKVTQGVEATLKGLEYHLKGYNICRGVLVFWFPFLTKFY